MVNEIIFENENARIIYEMEDFKNMFPLLDLSITDGELSESMALEMYHTVLQNKTVCLEVLA